MEGLKKIPNTTYFINKDAEVFNKFLKTMKVRKDGRINLNDGAGIKISINPKKIRFELFLN